MLLTDLLEPDGIDEAKLRDIAKASLLGAGLLGAGLGTANLGDRTPIAPAAITQPAHSADAAAEPKAAAAPQIAQNNPNFPAVLKGLDSKDAKTRVDTFKQVVLPLIDKENADIKRQRQALMQLANQKTLTKEQAAWIEGMKAYYKADNLKDLVAKVDIVPRSMALAQAAVESGWGQQPLAQQANVFYGQKTFDPEAPSATGPYGEKYRAFDSPEDSVRAYMRNLNTHPAYETFRSARADLRKHGKPLQGDRLIHSLTSYSTKGGYGQQLQSIIRSHGINKLDTN